MASLRTLIGLAGPAGPLVLDPSNRPAALVRAGSVVQLRVSAQHPMETGYRRSGAGELLPRNLLRRMECRFNGELVFAADLYAAVSANPYLAFDFKVPAVAQAEGALTISWAGDQGVQHTETVLLAVTLAVNSA
jgi:sulfur-oxidizing protein SoxZ